jgi:beta-fructofuranosidase
MAQPDPGQPTDSIMTLSRRAFLHVSSTAAFGALWGRSAFGAASADASLCRKLSSDPLRPQYHLLPSHNWMNDPNAPIYFGGRYHMFHQYNPRGATWGNMHWAHATSPDMIHWQHEPIALAPTPGGPDSDGVFSGSAVVDQGKVAVVYTGVAPPSSSGDATLRDGAHTWRERQCLAVAQDNDLRTWKKFPEPVILAPPPGLEVTGFRDPALWREGDKWMMVLGSGVRGKGGMILLYSSPDLRHWRYLHPLIEGAASKLASVNPVDTGEMWECPDFFPLGDKHVLLISTMGKVRWKVGTYSNQQFTPEKEGVVDWGSYYAAKTMLDANGRRILWGWIPESRPDAELIAAGWAGAMSLPRVLSLNPLNELQTVVASEIQKLRIEPLAMLTDPSSNSQGALDAVLIKNLAAEIEMQFRPGVDDSALRLYSDNGDFVSISFGKQTGTRELRVNRLNATLPGVPTSPVSLHIFLDGSVLEVFANETVALTARVYQIPSGPLRLGLEGNAKLLSLKAWQLKAISADRLAADCVVEA